MDDEILETFGRATFAPPPAPVVADQDAAARRVVADDLTIPNTECMKVDFSEERDRLPRLSGISRLDQAEQWRKVIANIRVSGAEEELGSCDREAHRVLIPVSYALGPLAIGRKSKDARVRRDEKRTARRIKAESMHMHGSRIAPLCVVVGEASCADDGGKDKNDHHR